METRRYHALDILRGLSLLLMICHHGAFDLISFGFLPAWLCDNPVFAVVQAFFAACFVAMSGASSRFSHNNFRRAVRILLAAAVVSGVTWFLGEGLFVRFGILHFLGVAALIYGLLRPLLDRLRVPGWVWLLLWLGGMWIFPVTSALRWLWPLGVVYPGFTSGDYYPIFPWIFMYFFGVWLADEIQADRLPAWFYRVRCGFLEAVSRHSLWLYLLHQPILYGLTLWLDHLVH